MTNKEAINQIEIARAEVEWEYPLDYSVAFDLAINALRKCELEQSDVGMFCPNCSTGVHKHIFRSDNSSVEVSFCPFCGEKLQW